MSASIYRSAESIIKKVGPCGSGSGLLAKDMDITGITRVVKIGIRHGNSIDALTISYERNGKVETTEQWGGEGGRLTEISLQPSEYITRVSGHIASWGNKWQVRSLILETNLNNFGPYGTQEGVPFNLPAFGGRIIGFFACAGSRLEAIGVYVKDKMDIVQSSTEPIIYKAGPCGSGSGVSAKDMNITGVTRIVKIDISHGNSIDSLTISYERYGGVESTERWGGQGAHLTEIKFRPIEYITRVSGHVASWGNTLQVRSLQLETNLNTYGPYGTQEGVPFELPAVGGKIIGFFARAGSMLEAIGVYMKSSAEYITGGAQNEANLHLYLYQKPFGPNENQIISVTPPINKDGFGVMAVNDWTVREGRDLGSKVVARAQGIHVQCGQNNPRWHCSFTMVFEDASFKGSTLMVRGCETSEWAIVGGTGQFTLAQGVVFGKIVSDDGNYGRITELFIHIFYRTIEKPKMG